MSDYFSTEKHPNKFEIMFSNKFKMYDFTILNNNKVLIIHGLISCCKITE